MPGDKKEVIKLDKVVVPEVLPQTKDKSPEERITDAKEVIKFVRHLMNGVHYDLSNIPEPARGYIIEQLERIEKALNGEPIIESEEEKKLRKLLENKL